MTTLYHGSHNPNLTEIRDGDPLAAVDFGGLFCSDDIEVALSHGEHVYCCEVAETDIADTLELRLWEDEIAALDLDATDDEIEAAVEDLGESWDTQILRGKIARALGFRAVEMSDEHGTSWLVFPGTELARRVH